MANLHRGISIRKAIIGAKIRRSSRGNKLLEVNELTPEASMFN